MTPTPVDVPGLLPVLPSGADPSRLVTAVSRNGTFGTLDLSTRQWVPAVRSTPDVARSLPLPQRAPGPMSFLATAQPALALVNVGLGLFNGVMSWKMNGKLNQVLERQTGLAAHFEYGFAALRADILDLKPLLLEQHQQVVASQERIHEEQLQTQAVELLALQIRVFDRGSDLADGRTKSRAQALDKAAGDLRAYVLATQSVRAKSPQARLGRHASPGTRRSGVPRCR